MLCSIVVDANILVSALLKDSITRRTLLSRKRQELFAPEFIKEEVFKYSEEFAKRLKVEKKSVEETLALLFETSKIMIMPTKEYPEFLPKALQISPDKNDAPYLALALRLDCPIWSQDKALKKQSFIKVFNTTELLKQL